MRYKCPCCKASNPTKFYIANDMEDFIIGCDACIKEVTPEECFSEEQKPFDVSEAVDFMEGKLDG